MDCWAYNDNATTITLHRLHLEDGNLTNILKAGQ